MSSLRTFSLFISFTTLILVATSLEIPRARPEPNNVDVDSRSNVNSFPSRGRSQTSLNLDSSAHTNVAASATTNVNNAPVAVDDDSDQDQVSTLEPLNPEDFKQAILSAVNAKRSLHGVPPLSVNSSLVAYADKIIEKVTTGVRKFYDSKPGYGYTLYWSSYIPKVKANEVVDLWYKQVRDYNWANPGYSGQTQAFSQLVWKKTTEFGVAVKKDDWGTYSVVATYYPEGNIPGEFRENVLPGGGQGSRN